MNWHDAQREMRAGKEIRLPEWPTLCCYRMEDGVLRVAISATEWLDSEPTPAEKARVDWELAP